MDRHRIKTFGVYGLCLLSPLLALFWIRQESLAIGILSSILLLYSLFFLLRRSLSSCIIPLILALGGFSLLCRPWNVTLEPTQNLFRIHAIQESPSQLRLTLISHDQHKKFLTIYYKPRSSQTKRWIGIFSGVGRIIEMRETRTQLRYLLGTPSGIIQLISRKKKLSIKQIDALKKGLGRKLSFQMPYRKFLTPLHVSRKHTHRAIHYRGYPEWIRFVDNLTTPKLLLRDYSHFPVVHIGDRIIPELRGTWKKIIPFVRPLYLFSQGYSFHASLAWLTIIPPASPTWTESILNHLLSFYAHSPYQSFYRSVLLARAPLDKTIYRLFQKNELVHLLVISGAHIELIISFLLFLLTFIFSIIYGIRHPKEWKAYFREIRFLRLGFRSFPLLMILSLFLIFYLNLIDSPQAGTRAIFGFFSIGLFFHKGWKVPILVPFALSIALCFLIYPQWLTYPLGLLYSSLAVFSLYFCIPIMNDLLDGVQNRVLYWLSYSLLTSTLISAFIAPISLHYFHYYNFFSIFTNILIGFLFTLFIYIAGLTSLLSFIGLPVALVFLALSDLCIKAMLQILTWSNYFSLFKVYGGISTFTMTTFYLILMVFLVDWRHHREIPDKLL